MRYKNLAIIGTSHIAQQSLDEVKGVIVKERPDIIALELDRHRAYALLHNLKSSLSFRDIRRLGIKGFLFALLGAWAEKKLGTLVGVAPGSEMLTALRIAKANSIGIAYIDQDISVTLKKLSAAITWREKWHFIVDLFNAIILHKQEFGFDLTKVPSDALIRRLIQKFKGRYPSLYKVLVVERNSFMAERLHSIMASNPYLKVVAIVGAGHEEGIISLLKKRNSGASYSFTISPPLQNGLYHQ